MPSSFDEAVTHFMPFGFYHAMLCMCGTSHGPVSVCLCLSQVGVLLKGLNVGSQKQRHTIAQELEFSYANAGGVGKNWRLSTNNQLYPKNGKR